MIKSEVEIILVEDNPEDAELTMRALVKGNILNKVKIIPDGAEAMEYFFPADSPNGSDFHNPKLIILDLKLPKIGGIEILQRLKSTDSTKAVPVVVLTSSKEEIDIIASYKLGANSFIVKPVNSDKFVEAVKLLGLYWLLLNEPPKI